MARPPPKRATKGSITTQIPLRLDAELAKLAARAARLEGVSLAEWFRRVARERLLRPA